MLTNLIFLMGLTLCVTLPLETAKADSGIVSKIIEALSGVELQNNTVALRKYISFSEKELSEQLNTNDRNGDKVSYTIFAPKSWAFSSIVPQDIGDPFFNDGELRLKMILRHITKDNVATDLMKSVTLKMMVDSATLTRSDEGKKFINEAEIISEKVPITGGFGFIYLVDHVFVCTSEVEDSINRFPSASIGVLSGTTEKAPTADEPNSSEETSTESVSSSPVVKGGYTKRDPEDDTVLEMAKFAAAFIGHARNVRTPLNLVNVISAKSQIVAGRNFILKIELSNESEKTICDVVVFDQPWTQRRELSTFDCQ